MVVSTAPSTVVSSFALSLAAAVATSSLLASIPHCITLSTSFYSLTLASFFIHATPLPPQTTPPACQHATSSSSSIPYYLMLYHWEARLECVEAAIKDVVQRSRRLALEFRPMGGEPSAIFLPLHLDCNDATSGESTSPQLASPPVAFYTTEDVPSGEARPCTDVEVFVLCAASDERGESRGHAAAERQGGRRHRRWISLYPSALFFQGKKSCEDFHPDNR